MSHFSLFFKDLNTNNFGPDEYVIDSDVESDELNDILNSVITAQEVRKAIQNVKKNKSPGDDLILNEYISSSLDTMTDVYVHIFNLVFDSGILPEAWLIGNVIPIFKNKGSKNDPKNYRPITLLSCIGKVFTSILNNRLNIYFDHFKILQENQAGFRQGYSTNDHIFSLYALFELLCIKKKKLHCAFMDFEKAFDFVHRNSLFYKLVLNNINGKFLKVVENMYKDAKSCIVHNNEKSEMFACEIGVRQGENLSPLLFCIYLNDLQEFLENAFVKGVDCISKDLENELVVYFKIFILLYADDTILLSESSEDLQNMLNEFDKYCEKWKLKINVKKTKVLIFSRGRISKHLKFFIRNDEIEIVKDYKYLGVYFSRSGSFLKTRKYLQEKAIKAMYGLLQKCRKNKLSIECQLDMFDRIVLPVLLYGSEIWGFENLDIIERVHLRFCKLILHLKPTTPNFMVYGELGRFPISVMIKVRMIKFWCRILNSSNDKLSFLLYKLLYINFNNYGYESKWLISVKSILENCGMSNIWLYQNTSTTDWISSAVEQKLKDQFLQEWHDAVYSSSKGLCYRIFKKRFELEKYITVLSFNNLYTFCKYRCGNHRLPVESGRWQNLQRNERLCPLCGSSDIGDEYHYILSCKALNYERRKYLPDYCKSNPNVIKLEKLFCSRNSIVLEKLCKFIKIINVKVAPPG